VKSSTYEPMGDISYLSLQNYIRYSSHRVRETRRVEEKMK
jgi:hypothetical protein